MNVADRPTEHPLERSGIGVDGCRGGWCGFVLSATGFDRGHVVQPRSIGACAPTLARLVDELDAPSGSRLCLDLPIGLPEGEDTRACDDAARRALGPRRSSVFAAPPRAVLEALDHATANATARRVSGRGLSLQSFHLLPKIREVDGWLRADRWERARTVECHPELAFARFAGAPLRDSKRTPAGRTERLELLESLLPGASDAAAELLAQHPRSRLAHDDVHDALVLALVAVLPAGALEVLGASEGELDGPVLDGAPLDGVGLPMRIVAPRADWRARVRPAR